MKTATFAIAAAAGLNVSPALAQQTHVGFLWHMHQPIYYPYETVQQTVAANRFSFSLFDVFNSRSGPYTTWPNDAVQKLAGMAHGGASVSFSGSLIENLNNLGWSNWDSPYQAGLTTPTSLGNARLDLVAFGYHHPLMPLLDERDLRMQIKLHREVFFNTWSPLGNAYPTGMFPPETAFHTRMIPALDAEGIEWIMVDNIHFDRACINYPHTDATGIPRPNRADQINPDPAANGGAWVQLQNLWAPSRVSAPFGYQPHLAQHVDPVTGDVSRITVVPAARYEGNEDGRGGYGAFLYDQVMDAYLQYNNDPQRPMFVLLHHDGDNFGGGSEAYYNSNFQAFANWISGDPDYDVTTVSDYLDRFPVPQNAVIHVAPGSWAGADAGDPEFKKWLGDPDANGVSPDRNSWAVLTAVKNRVFTAEDASPISSIANVLNGTGSATERAWHFLLVSQASDYWYWDGTEIWDSNVTRGANLAAAQADAVLTNLVVEATPPTVFLPQREPYNPGEIEFGNTPMPADFEVWTLAYDVSGLDSVTLYYRRDADGVNPLDTIENETFAGGPGVGQWIALPMQAEAVPTPPGVLQATHKAERWFAEINDERNVLLDYYVEAVDTQGNVERSDIQHVWVGDGQGSNPGGTGGVTVTPDPVEAGQTASITYDASAGPLASASVVFAHVGFNGWQTVVSPDPQMTDAGGGSWTLDIAIPPTATELNVVFNDGAGNWDNNGGADWAFPVQGTSDPGFTMDGVLDAGAEVVATRNGKSLWAAESDGVLYIATDETGGEDTFIYIAGENGPGALQQANWAKAGQVAAWEAFLAREGDNGWNGWFDAAGSIGNTSGSVLEGTIDLATEFGSMPAQVHLAVGVFISADGFSVIPSRQIPAPVVSDADITADEFAVFDLEPDAPVCPGDATGDGAVSALDVSAVLSAFGTSGHAPFSNGDVTGDGAVTALDISAVLSNFGSTCP